LLLVYKPSVLFHPHRLCRSPLNLLPSSSFLSTSTLFFLPFFDAMSCHDSFASFREEDRDWDVQSDIDTDSMSESSFPRFSASEGSSRTSFDFDMRSASPAPSVASMTSSLREQAYRLEYGRGLNNYSEVYRLPADDEELERLGTFSAPCS
jgi:hypothetical protein